MITAILSLDAKDAIGEGSNLAFTHKDDFKHFQSSTKDKIMVCGFGTYHQVQKLHGTLSRELILHSERDIAKFYDTDVFNKEQIVELSEYNDIMIIGGLRTYKLFADVTDEVILTKFKDYNPDADLFMDVDEVYSEFTKLEVLQEHEAFKIFKLTR